jgi:tetratricopeptide (TPR) repeat protein
MSVYEKEREEVLQCIKFKQFENSINICETVLDTMDFNDVESNTDRCFFNLRIGINYKRLKQCKKALVYIEKSMHYCSTQDEYMECIWMIGSCNDVLGNKKRALKFYNKCLDYFKRNEMFEQETYMLFNIGRLYKDIKTINKVIDIYNSNNIFDVSRKDNAYETLFEIYIEKNDIMNAEKMINNIVDLNTKQDLLAKMSDTYSICI